MKDRNNHYQIKRERLMKKDPHCYWCGQELVYFKTDGFIKKLPPNFATIDHLIEKFYPEEREKLWKKGISQTVLACFKCNQERGRDKVLSISIEERRQRDKILQERKKLGLITPRPEILKQAKIILLPSTKPRL